MMFGNAIIILTIVIILGAITLKQQKSLWIACYIFKELKICNNSRHPNKGISLQNTMLWVLAYIFDFYGFGFNFTKDIFYVLDREDKRTIV